MANPILSASGIASPQSIYDELSVAATNQSRAEGHHPIGTRAFLPDGRVFYYTSNSTVALTAGSLLVVPATTGLTRANTHDKIILTESFANFSVGARRPALKEADVDTNDIIENEYKDGYLFFENAAGAGGLCYKIKAHDGFDAGASSTSKVVELFDGIKVAAVATDEITFARNPYDRVITSTTAEEEAPVGVAPIAVTASDALATALDTAEIAATTRFFWSQTWGPCAVEVDDTTVASGVAVMSANTADRVEAAILVEGAPNTGYDRLHVGVGLVSAAAAAGDFVLVDLRIRP